MKLSSADEYGVGSWKIGDRIEQVSQAPSFGQVRHFDYMPVVGCRYRQISAQDGNLLAIGAKCGNLAPSSIFSSELVNFREVTRIVNVQHATKSVTSGQVPGIRAPRQIVEVGIGRSENEFFYNSTFLNIPNVD